MLWQQPRKKVKIKDLIWYSSWPLGHNPLDTFLSEVCDLSQHYTNHCIRVTGITNFKSNKCSDRQVMIVSGHKSLQSLALYTRVCDNEKRMMGLKLTYILLKPEEAQLARAVNKYQMTSLEGEDTENPEPKCKKNEIS